MERISILHRMLGSESAVGWSENANMIRDSQAKRLFNLIVEEFSSMDEGFTIDDIRNSFNYLTQTAPREGYEPGKKYNSNSFITSGVRYGSSHLNRLVDMGYLREEEDKYFIANSMSNLETELDNLRGRNR